MRVLSLLAAMAMLVAPAVQARAAEFPLNRSALLAAIKTDHVWCSRWSETEQSCEDVTFMETGKKGAITQTRRYLLSAESDLEMVIREEVQVEGGALCSTFRFNKLDIAVLSGGVAAPLEQAATTKALVRIMMADLEGKKTCESFSRDTATGNLTSKVTLDGEAAPEFDTYYRLIDPDTRIQLRPVFEQPETTTIT